MHSDNIEMFHHHPQYMQLCRNLLYMTVFSLEVESYSSNDQTNHLCYEHKHIVDSLELLLSQLSEVKNVLWRK